MAAVPPGALLLYGDLGAGKTTLVRSIVEALPGGGAAEVSSPSFTICNIYCTTPQVRHFDLYRCETGFPDDSLAEAFDDACALTFVEWPERLSERDLPADALICRLTRLADEDSRLAALSATGVRAACCLETFRSLHLPA
jgi:tRNA threonylcarbamoyladenosine biosynthesis protein TsaE